MGIFINVYWFKSCFLLTHPGTKLINRLKIINLFGEFNMAHDQWNKKDPSHDVDASKLDNDHKLKYFDNLGLLKGDEGLSHDRPSREKSFSLESLGHELRQVFDKHPIYVRDIIEKLKVTPKEHFKATVHAAFDALHHAKGDERHIHTAIVDAIEKSKHKFTK